MEDLPICISSSFFALFSLFFLPFLTSVCFQEQREAGRVHPRAWLGAQGDSQRAGSWSPREQLASLCALLVLLCACSLIIWSWWFDQWIAWDGVRRGDGVWWKVCFDIFLLMVLHLPNLPAKSQTLCEPQRLLGSGVEQCANVHQSNGEPLSSRLVKCNTLCCNVAKVLFLTIFPSNETITAGDKLKISWQANT